VFTVAGDEIAASPHNPTPLTPSAFESFILSGPVVPFVASFVSFVMNQLSRGKRANSPIDP